MALEIENYQILIDLSTQQTNQKNHKPHKKVWNIKKIKPRIDNVKKKKEHSYITYFNVRNRWKNFSEHLFGTKELY